ncbi:MAG: hypothetical protein RR091_10830 [Cloacibacillus sp.]
MKITTDQSLGNFRFWGGAADRAALLTYNQLEEIEAQLTCEYPDGIDETELNDMFWFDFEYVCSLAGIELTEDEEPVTAE